MERLKPQALTLHAWLRYGHGQRTDYSFPAKIPPRMSPRGLGRPNQTGLATKGTKCAKRKRRYSAGAFVSFVLFVAENLGQ